MGAAKPSGCWWRLLTTTKGRPPGTESLQAARLAELGVVQFIAALLSSLVAITEIIVRDTEFGFTKIWDA
jgi:hypothetical protein